MRQSVRDAFISFSEKFEGRVNWLYQDIKGLVTTGIGNLVDPVELCLPLSFTSADGTPATRDEILAAWSTVKNTPTLAVSGYRAAEHLTTIRLTNGAIDVLVYAKLDEMWAHLLDRFPALDAWPSDAQLGLTSMAWSAGPWFKAPMFDGFCRAVDFRGAAAECRFNDTQNPGLKPRNDANERLFINAANIVEGKLDREELYYPTFVLRQVNV